MGSEPILIAVGDGVLNLTSYRDELLKRKPGCRADMVQDHFLAVYSELLALRRVRDAAAAYMGDGACESHIEPDATCAECVLRAALLLAGQEGERG